MEKKAKANRPKLNSASVADDLDALNADRSHRVKPAEQVRRKMEATIEAKTKQRRGREAPASSAWKR
jgi:hypothetical protein